MGDKSKIEWTDATWNPVVGCTRVSAGCDHCYAFQLHDTRHVAWKRGRMPTAPPQYHVPFSTVQTFPARLDQPLRWRRPRRIFVNSLSDLFHDAVPDEFIDRVFGVMGRAKWHTFQILTKRPKRMAEYVASPGRSERVCAAADAMPGGLSGAICQGFWPLPNVWLGVSVEDQRAADERIPLLLETPAAVRFLSCEPLLGPVDLKGYLPFQVELPPRPDRYFGWRRGIDWVIVGGE
jgi:protein gp37